MHFINRVGLTSKSFIRFYTQRNILQLHDRGIIHNIFPEKSQNDIIHMLNKSPQCVYAGFDPTASSLHVGNLLVLVKLLHWQRAGHNVIALIGGATGRIGDPSGRTTERSLMEDLQVDDNIKGVKDNIIKIFDNHEKYFWQKNSQTSDKLNPVMIVNNEEWYRKIDAINFVSNIGRSFRMGTMLLKQSVQTRINSDLGMSFTEFSYQIFQSYDWLHLLRNYQCRFQIGGSDQMGNIVSGHELIKKLEKKNIFGMTLPLVTTEEGDKFGKSAGNAIWLDENKTSAFALYQFFLRTNDADVEKFLKLFTFLSLNEIKQLMELHKEKPEKRIPQRSLAEQLTLLVHGDEGLKKAEKATEALYSNNIESLLSLDSIETKQIFQGATNVSVMMEPGITVLDLAMKVKCFPTERDAMRIISAGGFHINHQKVMNFQEMLTDCSHILPNKLSLIRVGKKNYYIVNWFS